MANDLNPNSPETKVPALPAPQSQQQLLQALKELVEVREGIRGNPLDQNVTWRELVKSGVANIVINGQEIGGSDPTFPLQPPAGSNDLTPPPQPVGLAATGAIQNVILSWNDPGNLSIAYTEIWRSSTTTAPDAAGTAAVLVGTTEAYLYADDVGLSNATRYYWVRFRSKADVPGPFSARVTGSTALVGGVDLSDAVITSQKIANGAISAHEAFGGSLRPVASGATLPTLPDAAKYAAGALFFLTTDSKLYRSTGTTWVVNVPAGDITGQLTNTQIADLAAAKITGTLVSSQIANAAITTAKFASGIEPVTIVSSVPGTKSTETILNTTDRKLYRWNGTAYVASVSTTDLSGTVTDAQIDGLAASKVTGQLTNSQIADLAATKVTGQITATQITDGAISTPKLAAGSVSTAKLAAGAVTANEIAADAVTSAKIIAGAITTAKIAAGAVTANEIAASAVTAGKIAAGAVTATEIAADTITAAQIAAGAISASELAAGAVTTAKLAAGAVTANELAANSVVAGKIATNAVTADNILAGAVQTTKLSVLVQEYVNPSSITGTLNGWGGITEGGVGSNAQLSYNATEGAIQLRSTANHSLRSDAWQVNHDKIYRVSVKVRKDIAGGDLYIGLSAFSVFTAGQVSTGGSTGTQTVTPYNSSRVAGTPASNVYFFSTGAATDVYVTHVYYIVGANASVNDAPAHVGTGSGPFIQLSSAATWVALRFLNWDNATVQRDLFIKDVSVTEVGAGQIVASNIQAGTITGDRIAAGTIAASNIATGTITADRIATGTITAASGVIANAAITNAAIANLAVDAAKIADLTIVEGKIADAAITNAKIGNAAITDAKIAAATITTASIANAAITGAKIANATITAANITDATITGAKIGSATITGANIGSATIGGANIASATITGANIASATIGGANIASATISGANIANATITDANIGSLNAGKITAGTLDAARIAAGTITGTMIAGTTIQAGNIAAGTITATQIATGTITANRIAAGTITANEIADTTITGSKIVNGTITGTQIAGSTITGSLIANGTITGTNILDGTITGAEIAGSTITASNIANTTITGALIADSTITTAKIAGTIESDNWSSTSGWQINRAGTATFNEVAVRGQINTGNYVGYAWPAAGGNGVHLSNSGLLLGNYNGTGGNARGFLQFDVASGELYIGRGQTTKLQVDSSGNLTITGSLTASAVNAVNTVNVTPRAVTFPISTTGTADTNGGPAVTVTDALASERILLIAYFEPTTSTVTGTATNYLRYSNADVLEEDTQYGVPSDGGGGTIYSFSGQTVITVYTPGSAGNAGFYINSSLSRGAILYAVQTKR